MRKKIYKCLLLLGIFIFTAGCLAGCSFSSHLNRKKAESALRKKYNEDFEVTYFRSGGLFQGYDTMMAHSVNYPDLTFYLDLSDSGRVSDSYVTARLCHRISEQISSNIRDLDETYYVYTQAMLPISYLTDPEVTLSEYLEEGPNKFLIELFLIHTDTTAVDIVTGLFPIMEGLQEVSGSVSLYFVDEPMMDRVKEYLATHDQIYGEFTEMTDDAYIGTVNFENGGFSLTENKLREMAGDRL